MPFYSCGCKNNAHAHIVNGLIARARVYALFLLYLLDKRQLLLRRPTSMPSAIVSAHMGCCACCQTVSEPTCDHHRPHHYMFVGDCDVRTMCDDFLDDLQFAAFAHYHSHMNVRSTNGTCLCMCVCVVFYTFVNFQVSQSNVGINTYANRIILRRRQQKSCDAKVHRKLSAE